MALQLQVPGELADGWRFRAGMAFDRYQQLVLGVCQPGLGRLILAPAQETTQRRAEPEKVLEILMRRLNRIALLRVKPESIVTRRSLCRAAAVPRPYVAGPQTPRARSG